MCRVLSFVVIVLLEEVFCLTFKVDLWFSEDHFVVSFFTFFIYCVLPDAFAQLRDQLFPLVWV